MVNDSEKLLDFAAKQYFKTPCSVGNWRFQLRGVPSFVIAYNGEPVVTCKNNQITDAKWGSRVADVEVYDVLKSVLEHLPGIQLDPMTIRTDEGFAVLGYDGPSVKIAEIPGMEDIDYYRAWVTSKPNAADPTKMDHIVYWDQGNTWCEVLAVFEGVTHEEFVTQMHTKYNEWIQEEADLANKQDYSQLTTEELVQMEQSAYADYYKLATTPCTNPSKEDLESLEKATSRWEAICEELRVRKQPLDSQIQSASNRAAASQPTSHVKAKEPEPEF